jgi:hypothetical protein
MSLHTQLDFFFFKLQKVDSTTMNVNHVPSTLGLFPKVCLELQEYGWI